MNWKLMAKAMISLAVLAVLAIGGSRIVAASSEADAIAAKFVAGWNSHDPAKLVALFTDDVFYEDVAFGELSHGKVELSKFAASEFEGVPDLELKLVRAAIHDGHGTIEWSFTGTDKGVYKTGKKFTVRGVSVVDVRDGKFSRSLDFYDVATVMRQVGVLPAQ
ncbi:MAG TPA: nuclear transport factor 2 family protein [Terriglobales bacterium]|jgi:steroid delta-isomerase-like uncharacterized protein|nr:nuclear transport factor 2 family protein [Terriglobales bacterium]